MVRVFGVMKATNQQVQDLARGLTFSLSCEGDAGPEERGDIAFALRSIDCDASEGEIDRVVHRLVATYED